MKKSLFALAALGAFAGAAQAQSSVTLWGNLDASVNYLGNAGPTSSASAAGSITQPTNASTSDPTKAGPTLGNAPLVLYDSAISTSQWGMKGTEDLGGGMKANFFVAGDLPTNNGGSNTSGVFRRGAWVGLQGGFGEIRLGTQNNPIVDASASLLPVMGNTVNQIRNVIGYAGADFNRNAISYVTPVMNGFGAVAQYALNNTVDDGVTDGSVMNLRAFYSNSNLDVNAAYQKRYSMAATGNGALCSTMATDTASTSATGSTVSTTGQYPNITCPAANYGGDVTGYLAGVKYKVTPALQLGIAWAHGDGDNTNYVAGANSANATAIAAGATAAKVVTYSGNALMLGAGYQATPTVLLGLNYIVTNADSSLYNFQTRYALSKRTTAYFQATMAKNGAGSEQSGGASNIAYGDFAAIQGNTVSNPSIQVQGLTATGAGGTGGMPNSTLTNFGVGVIHSF
jgi:predicted porin